MFLICGETLCDVFVTDERADGLTLDARPGGSPFNVAVGLARLGQPVEMLTGLSMDCFGGFLEAYLARERVGTGYVLRTPKPTRLAVVAVDAGGLPSYSFPVQDCADRSVLAADIPALAPEVAAIHLGSIATVQEPVAGSLRKLLEREGTGGRLVSYDPNVRPTVEPNLEAWRRTLEELAERAHLLKISREDFDLLYPRREAAAAAQEWLDRGVRLVVMTDGHQGVCGWTRRQQVRVPVRAVAVSDTVGAGDSFQAGLLAALAETGRLSPQGVAEVSAAELEALLGFAGRCAGITCSRRGADLPRRGELPSMGSAPADIPGGAGG